MNSKQVRILTLNKNENNSSKLFMLKKGWTIHFVPGPSLVGHRINLYTNHPINEDDKHATEKFTLLPWYSYVQSNKSAYSIYASVKMRLAGTFRYLFRIDDSQSASGQGHFIVQPQLYFDPVSNVNSDLNNIRCLTVISKLLGPFDQWTDRLRIAKLTGYNMIHFTPTQELGKSGSSYCIKDQLSTNSTFCDKSGLNLEKILSKIHKDWKILSMADLVLNHTANESRWLLEHPESAYSTYTSPHLRPAYLLDRYLYRLSIEYTNADNTKHTIKYDSDFIDKLRQRILADSSSFLRLHEFYLIHVDNTIIEYKNRLKDFDENQKEMSPNHNKNIEIIQDDTYNRLSCTIDFNLALLKYGNDVTTLKHLLEKLNGIKYIEICEILKHSVENFLDNVKWRFVHHHGLKLEFITKDSPLMWNYFIIPKEYFKTFQEEEDYMNSYQSKYCMAHNGWVINADPMLNFAEKESQVYLRRELIPWGDNVKLRYGQLPCNAPNNGPSNKPVIDNSFLWRHMAEYCRKTARTFHAIRLDNCHSTPLHVAKYMLEQARDIRPDLYVIAELFTNNLATDCIFINTLGLNSLVREAMNPHNAETLSNYIQEAGGEPIGSIMQPFARELRNVPPHVILMDQSHDNPTFTEKRTVYDTLSTSALVCMSSAATGSNRGADELFKSHVNVVKESKLYPKHCETSGLYGICVAKLFLNELHSHLSENNFSQVFVDKLGHDVTAVTRHNPVTHVNIIMITRSKFNDSASTTPVQIDIPGRITRILCEASLKKVQIDEEMPENCSELLGQKQFSCSVKKEIDIESSEMVRLCNHSNSLDIYNLMPGSFVCLSTSLNNEERKSIIAIRELLSTFGFRMKTYSGRDLKLISGTELESIVSKLTLSDIGYTLYRVNGETEGDNVYVIPDYGAVCFCGLQGIIPLIHEIRKSNDLGHPLCKNLRFGNWLMDFISNRLIRNPNTYKLGVWFRELFSILCCISRHLIPSYFFAIVEGVHSLLEEVSVAKMSSFIKDGSSFERSLALSSLQFFCKVKDANLPLTEYKISDTPIESMSAGLPHFSTGIWRNWGRDTFISMRGLALLTGRHKLAIQHVLAYAGAIRHGLIPNLLSDYGKNARFNCRDSVWFWLQTIQEIYKYDDGILNYKVLRIFPNDDSDEKQEKISQPLFQVIQEVMQKHSEGIHFRERNSGSQIDAHMVSKGFQIDIGIDWPETGFVYGGNASNCGTWMDKMGSTPARNQGTPATPRDGSAVELVALCKSAVSWLNNLHFDSKFPFDGVEMLNKKTNQKEHVTYKEWSHCIQMTFDPSFYVNENEINNLANRKFIYRDCLNSSSEFTDFQLRPNFTIAMNIAPELFNKKHADLALRQVQRHLLAPIGMKTLDPGDLQYNAFYSPDDENNGFNYHQGPEWIWPLGFFLRAWLRFSSDNMEQRISYINCILSTVYDTLKTTRWNSLPELTNENGATCKASCNSQAWSVATIIETLYDISMIHNVHKPKKQELE